MYQPVHTTDFSPALICIQNFPLGFSHIQENEALIKAVQGPQQLLVGLQADAAQISRVLQNLCPKYALHQVIVFVCRH